MCTFKPGGGIINTKEILLSFTSALTSAALLANFSAVTGYAVSYDSEIKRDAVVTLADIGYSPADILSNVDSGFLFADQLDENNTASYKGMEEYLSDMSNTSFTVKLTDSIVLERSSSSMSHWSDEEYTEYAEAVLGAVMPGVIAFTLDYPEVFWLNFAEIGCSSPKASVSFDMFSSKHYKFTISEISIEPNFDSNYTDFDTILVLKNRAEEEVQSFEVAGDTDYDKCKSIYQCIIDRTDYDMSAPYAHGIAGVLCDGKAVCEGYSKTFKMLCDRENIPCISVLGNYDAENLTAHMWNYVYLDDAWYGCDPTFDESTGNFTYFMRGSDFFNKYHRPESPYSITVLSFPDLSETDYGSMPAETTTTTTDTTISTTTTLTTTSSSETVTETESEMATTSTVSFTISSETETITSYETIATETTNTTASETTTITTFQTTTAITTTSHIEEPVCGDVNGDGRVTIIDLVALRKYLIGIGEYSAAFDCNKDGKINIFDAVYLTSMLLKK